MVRIVTLACAIAVSLLSVGAAVSQDNFYNRKQMTMLIAIGAGSGIDAYGRLVAKHLPRYIPGNPTIVPQNMPGASGLTAIRHLDSIAPKDGSVILTFLPSQLIISSMFDPKVGVNFSQFSWLGSVSNDLRICYVINTTGIKTWSDVLKRDQVVMGNSGTSTPSYMDQRILSEIFGVKLKQVQGYPSGAEKRLAMERGELDGDCGPWTSTPPDWIENKTINILIRLQRGEAEGLSEGIPVAADLVRNEQDKQVLALLGASSELGRSFLLSKDIPASRLKILREAFNNLMKDPQFLAEASQQRLSVAPMSGDVAEQLVRDLYASSPDVLARAKSLVNE